MSPTRYLVSLRGVCVWMCKGLPQLLSFRWHTVTHKTMRLIIISHKLHKGFSKVCGHVLLLIPVSGTARSRCGTITVLLISPSDISWCKPQLDWGGVDMPSERPWRTGLSACCVFAVAWLWHLCGIFYMPPLIRRSTAQASKVAVVLRGVFLFSSTGFVVTSCLFTWGCNHNGGKYSTA